MLDGLAQRYGTDPWTILWWSRTRTAFDYRCAVLSEQYREQNMERR